MVGPCAPLNWPCKNHLARDSERRSKKRKTKEEMGRQHQGLDRIELPRVPKSDRRQRRVEKSSGYVFSGAPTTSRRSHGIGNR